MRAIVLSLVVALTAAAYPAAAQIADPEPDPAEARPRREAPPSPLATGPDASGAATQAQPPVVYSPLVLAIKQRAQDRRVNVPADDKAAIVAIFEERNGPLFTDANGLSPRGRAVIEEIKAADDWGLTASDLVPRLPESTGGTPSELAELEWQVASAALKYARHARGGRIAEPSKQLATYIDRTPQLLPPRDVLRKLAEASDPAATLRGFNPQHPHFMALRAAYVEARKAGAAAADTAGIKSGGRVKPGERDPDVVILRQILKVPAADGADPEVMDDAVAAALRSFQAARGEKADGILGRKTRALLAAAPSKGVSARELLVNMEQWRWMPAELGETHIAVNIPDFTIRMVRNGQLVHSERVVTGLVTNQTPIFSDELKTVVLLPDWVLPESIKVREAIPSLLSGGGMFYTNGLKIKKGNTPVDPRSVDWYSANQKNYTFYQPPGDRNVLGKVKFLFPNKHAVYFHDTPTKHLFEKAERAYSHGCMRVRNPVKLAQLVLEHDKGWSAQQVNDLVESGPEDNRVALDKPIPVHVTYFTVMPGPDGKLVTHRDVYGHSKRISLALDGRWGEIDIPPDHLAPIEDREFEYRTANMDRRRGANSWDLFDDGGYYYENQRGVPSRRYRQERYNPPSFNIFQGLFGD